MLRSSKSHPLGSQFREGSIQSVGVDYGYLPMLRLCQRPSDREHTLELSLLVEEARV